MDRFQLEKLYEINGLKDYKLRNTDDLLKTHGIDYREVAGFKRLDDVNRQLYEKFIINFFNGLGLDSRMTLIPKGIYYVQDYDLLVKENPEDDYYNVAGGVVMAIDRNGLKTVHRIWHDEDYSHLKPKKGKSKTYLRFEYEHYGRREWQHVVGEKTWY